MAALCLTLGLSAMLHPVAAMQLGWRLQNQWETRRRLHAVHRRSGLACASPALAGIDSEAIMN